MEKKEAGLGKMKTEYDFGSVMTMGKELGNHVGEWVAIVDKKIVAKGKDAKKVFDKTKKAYPTKIPYIMKIPSDGVMLL